MFKNSAKCEVIAYILYFCNFYYLQKSLHANRNNQEFFRSAALSKDHMLPKPLNYVFLMRLFLLIAQIEDLSKWTLVLLYSWNNPLHHLVTELQHMKELSNAFLSSATRFENMSEKLQAFIERQFSNVSILQRAFLLCS